MEPTATRPYMPGYGVLAADAGHGLLPWSWAEQRLRTSHDYWVASVRPDGRPHVMPVWGMWADGAVVFSTSRGSRKARNLAGDRRCCVTTDDPRHPVVVEGVAEEVADGAAYERFLAALGEKYGEKLSAADLPFAANTCLLVRPVVVFGLDSEDFPGTPTRWRFR